MSELTEQTKSLSSRTLIVYEFSDSQEEQMVPGLCEVLRRRGFRIQTVQGLFRRYRPGGIRANRLLNLLWMVLALPLVLVFWRPEQVLVRSTPPGIQVWAGLWMRLLRLRAVLWLMDYHPEIEARWLAGHGFFGRTVAAFLRVLDRISFKAYPLAVVLDPAMAETLRRNGYNGEVKVFPTWGLEMGWSRRPAVYPSADKPLAVLYGGNLGAGHDWQGLDECLRSAGPVRLCVVGAGEEGERRFAEAFGGNPSIALEFYPRKTFVELVDWIGVEGIHYGIVLMKREIRGLLSPSKYTAYLAAGLPILYGGPKGSNADRICREFGGGVTIDGEMKGSSHWLRAGYGMRLDGVAQAQKYFNKFNAERFVDEILLR